MIKVRSISGDWIRLVARQQYPTLKGRAKYEAMAEVLGCSVRSLYAYVADSRRVPEPIERRFIEAYGEPAPDAWREIELYQVRRIEEERDPADEPEPRKPGRNAEEIAAYVENWRLNTQVQARNLAQIALNHRLGEFWQNPITRGQLLQTEKGLDHEEALARYPQSFYELVTPHDWVVECQICGLLGSVDTSAQEVNGLVFRVTCGTESYKVGA